MKYFTIVEFCQLLMIIIKLFNKQRQDIMEQYEFHNGANQKW
jgi:hypothetical protein